MAEVDSKVVTEIAPALGVKEFMIVTAATADNGNTVTVDLTAHGCKNIHGIIGFTESTTGSIVITEAPTTTVTAGSLVITIGGSTPNKVRTFVIYAY